MSDQKELTRIHRLLMEVVKKSTDAVAKVTDPMNKSMLSRVSSVNYTMSEAIKASIDHENSKTDKREAEVKEGGSSDSPPLRVEA
jgi:hypothetical protein